MSVNQPPEFVKRLERKADAFLGGKLSIEQPEHGFRAGLDSVLLGASVPKSCASLLDLGAGAGVAALSALAHNSGLKATLIETNSAMSTLATRNIEHNAMTHRARVIELDATASGAERKALGLGTDHFDIVIANPPFFGVGSKAPDAARAQARHTDGEVSAWVRTAVSCAHAKGSVVFIHLASALPQLLAAFHTRLGAITVLPIAPRPGAEATRVLIRGRKGSRSAMRLLSPLVLHEAEGNHFSEPVDAILRGRSVLDWH